MTHATASRRLLHISASPRGAASESLGIAATFLDVFADGHPDTEIETFDLWDGTLPAFGPDAAAAKMSVFAGAEPHGREALAWAAATDAFRRFDAADSYLFSVPMWNHGVPYILKQFIDVISQPGLVFGFDPVTGYQPLLRHKRAAVIYTSAVYGVGRGPAFGTDFQQPYLNDWLRWVGVTDVREVFFRPEPRHRRRRLRPASGARRGPGPGKGVLITRRRSRAAATPRTPPPRPSWPG